MAGDRQFVQRAAVAFISLTIFCMALAAVCAEFWMTDPLGRQRGLWKNNDVKTSADTDGVEVVRGTAVIAAVVSFVLFFFALHDFSQGMNVKTFLEFDAGSPIVYASGTCTFYSLIAASIYTSYIGSGYKMGPSTALFWVSFVLSLLQTCYTAYDMIKNDSGEDKCIAKSDENQERGNWDRHSEYLLSMIGYAVGLGNVWRFPYLCYENGGGAFLIPYVVMLVFVGLPVFYMECAVGQFDSQGPIESWNVTPALRGVGAMMVIYSAFVGIYYNVIIAYSIYYFFGSLDSNMPWTGCDGFWVEKAKCAVMSANTSSLITGDDSIMSSSEHYYRAHMLNFVGNMDAEGAHDINWKIVITLIVAWTVVFFSLIRGIKSSGKVVWFTAIFPYVVILILLIRGCTLPGARKGIDFYIGKSSDFSKLKDINVWRKAATQIFFSLSAGWGGVQALSSYNNFKNNCYRDSLIVAITNCCTSIIAGFAIFSILGYMATTLNVEVTEVVKSSFGLAFIAYPTALAQIPGGPFWACLFFLMLFTLGLDSQFTILETVATALCDYSDKFRKNRVAMMGSLSITLFVLGLLCCTRTGLNWVDIIDSYVGGWALLFSTILEIIALGTIYGGGLPAWIMGHPQKLCEDIEMMIGPRSNLWWFFWRATWYVVTPGIMIALLIGSWVQYQGGDFPGWAQGIGWLFVLLGLIFLPGFMIWEIYCSVSAGHSWTHAFKENDKWGPYLSEYHVGRYAKCKNSGEMNTNAAYES